MVRGVSKAKIVDENAVPFERMAYREAFFSLVTPSEEKTLLKHQATSSGPVGTFGAEGEAGIFGKQSFGCEEKKVNINENTPTVNTNTDPLIFAEHSGGHSINV